MFKALSTPIENHGFNFFFGVLNLIVVVTFSFRKNVYMLEVKTVFPIYIPDYLKWTLATPAEKCPTGFK